MKSTKLLVGLGVVVATAVACGGSGNGGAANDGGGGSDSTANMSSSSSGGGSSSGVGIPGLDAFPMAMPGCNPQGCPGQDCCYDTSNPAGTSSCVAKGSCTGSVLTCAGTSDCSGGQICCFTFMMAGAMSGPFTTQCQASCAMGSYQLCSMNSTTDCAAGVMCSMGTYTPYCAAPFNVDAGFPFGGDGGFPVRDGGARGDAGGTDGGTTSDAGSTGDGGDAGAASDGSAD